GLEITNKYINVYKERGKDVGVQLRLNKEIDRIVTTKTITNLATGLEVTGGTPEESETPITLKGYKYDDGDFYVSGTRLYSRKALQKWSRYQWDKEPNKTTEGGHIVRQYSYDTTSQKELCAHAVAELKSICDMEVNY
ncbi:MAG: phage tail protein, partial [Clostridia bacterium]|nr:phage tail protein [Clostridia bacterium]